MMYLLFRAARKAHHLTGKLYAWAQDCWCPLYTAKQRRERFLAQGRIPWSVGYIEEREWFAAQQFSSQERMKDFASGQIGFLPEGYGLNLDERCVEWPWAMARLGNVSRVLDAGSALNHPHILSLPLWKERKLDIYTLAPEEVCEWTRGISYLYGDLRRLPYRDHEFDCVVSISTLEHIGMDNSMFSGMEVHKEHATGDILLVLEELRRVMKPGGSLLFTVPYGRYEDHETFQQFDCEIVEQCAHRFAPSDRQDTYFLYTAKGWQAVAQKECDSASYAINAVAELEPDHAAAARAVACCHWRIA